jgi:hypothetical protein
MGVASVNVRKGFAQDAFRQKNHRRIIWNPRLLPRAYRHEDFDWALAQFRVDAHTLNHSRLNAIDANRRPSLQTRSALEVRLQVLVAGLWLSECEPTQVSPTTTMRAKTTFRISPR